MLERYRTLFRGFFAQDLTQAKRKFWVTLATSAIALTAFYICYSQVVGKSARGLLTVGQLTLALAVLRQGQTAFERLLQLLADQYEHALYLSNLFAFLSYPESDVRPALDPPRQLPVGPHAIEFRGVSFRYPG